MTVRVFTDADPGAPQLIGQNGSLIAMLRACLIDGYGDTDPVGGWTVPFEDQPTSRAVFRQPVARSSGRYLYIDDGIASKADVQAYDEVTDIDTRITPFCPNQPKWSYLTSGSDNTPRKWFLISDDATGTFYLFLRGSPAAFTDWGVDGDCFIYGFGDLLPMPWFSFSPSSFILGGTLYTSAGNTFGRGGFNDSPQVYCGIFPGNRKPTPTGELIRVSQTLISTQSLSGTPGIPTQAQASFKNSLGGGDIIVNPEVIASGSGASSATGDNLKVAGRIPGIHFAGIWDDPKNAGQILTGVGGYPDIDFYRVPISSSATNSATSSCCYVNVSGWV